MVLLLSGQTSRAIYGTNM